MIHVDPTGGGMGVEQGRYYYVADRLGHVIAMVDQGGVAVDRYVYSPYGVQDRLSGSGNRSLRLTPPERRRRVHPYTGRKYDALTGLYYYRARYFSVDLGRFLETDPVGYADQMNLYGYVSNDPLNLTDPTGKFGRGKGFTDKQWEKFDRAQQSAAKKMRRTANNLIKRGLRQLDKGNGEKGMEMITQAMSLNGGASALESNGSDGYVANGVSQADYLARGGSNGGAAFISRLPNGSPGTVMTANLDHSLFGTSNEYQRVLGHESLHTAKVGLRDERGPNGEKAYKMSDSPGQRKAYQDLIGDPFATINPDHLMHLVFPRIKY